MDSLDKKIIYYLTGIKKRINTENTIKYILLAVSYACIAGILLSIVSFFIPIYEVYTKATLFILLSVVLGLVLAIIKRYGFTHAAMRADSLGLKERVITSLELSGDESAMSLLQREDALEYLRNLEYKKRVPLLPKKKYFFICFILITALITTGFIENPMKQRALKLQEFRSLKRSQLKDIDKLIEKIIGDKKLSLEQKRELETKLSQIRKDARTAKNMEELKKSLERNQRKIELLNNKYTENKKTFDKTVDTLLKNKWTRDIGELLKNKNSAEAKKAVKDLTKKLNNLSSKEKTELSESLKKLAEELKNNKELSEALNKASEKLSKDKELNNEDMEELADAISELAEDENIKSTLEDINKELSKLNANKDGKKPQKDGKKEVGEQNGEKDSDEEASNLDKDKREDSDSRSGIGTQKNNGKGQSSMETQQIGDNNGQNSSGVGNGTDPGSENQTPNQTKGNSNGNKEASEKKIGTYEKIFTSKTLGGTGEKMELKGQKKNGGSSQTTSGESTQGNSGSSVPYNQVFGEYRDEAFESLNNFNIPEGMKEIIKDYFSSLE